MSQPFSSQDKPLLTMQFIVEPEDRKRPDPATMRSVVISVVTELDKDEYTVTIPYTGLRGGGLIREIIPHLQPLGEYAIAHKDALISAFKTLVLPVFERIGEVRKERQEKALVQHAPVLGGIKIEAEVGEDYYIFKGESTDLVGTEKVEELFNKLLASRQPLLSQPQLSSQPNNRLIEGNIPRPFIKITEEVPSPAHN